MDIYVRVKAIGKRKDILAPTPYTIPDGICSLRQLLTAVVQKEVAQYNSKETEAQLIPFLTQQELDDQAKIGKVSFGTIYSDKKADPGKAVTNAIGCWEDGLVRYSTPLPLPRSPRFQRFGLKAHSRSLLHIWRL